MCPAVVSDPALRDWLMLVRAPGLGTVTRHRLLQHFGSPRAIFDAPATVLAGHGVRRKARNGLHAVPETAIRSDLEWLSDAEHHFITWDDTRYPRLLREIPDPPVALFVRGNPDLLDQHQLAVVGSRSATPPGLETARELARVLASAGLIITSGMALGIDAASHRGTLDVGGNTLAVTGCGPDIVYPARHRSLAGEIVHSGALVSEFPPGTPPRAENFPRRNRVISGMSLGTLVVEAAPRSGSLITARLAAEQGREVFAVPGSIHNPRARGCHELIRQGAKLVERAKDILEELGPLAATLVSPVDQPPVAAPDPLQPEERKLLDCLGYEAVAMDTLIDRSGLTPEALSSMLTLLEMRGYVAAVAGGQYVCIGKRS